MLSGAMLSTIMWSVVMLSVVAVLRRHHDTQHNGIQDNDTQHYN